MSVLNVSTGYNPRPLQAVIHRQLKRFNVICLHRRAGKTHLSLNELIDRAFRNQNKSPQYAYVAPTYGQAKRVAWDLLKSYLQNIPGVEFNESELRADVPRPANRDKIRFILLGAENPDSLRGIYLDGVIFDEFADSQPIVWTQVVRPLLTDRQGFAIFIGTPKGQNHFYDIYQQAKNDTSGEWFACLHKASETGIIPKSELEQARSIMSESEYEQEFECSFAAALVGAYFGKELEKAEAAGRISRVPYDKALPCVTAFDLGIDDSTAIWIAQIYGREVRLIEYIENSGTGLDSYVKLLMEKEYRYSKHLLPHDVTVREMTTGKSRLESIRTMGLKNVEVVPKLSVEDGINAARLLINKSWFDVEKCARGITALKNYQRKWDPKNKVFQMKPHHDWASHSADSFRTLAVGLREDAPTDEQRKNYPRQTVLDYSVV